MERKRANTTPLLLESRSMHGASQNDPYFPQFPSLEPKMCKLLPDISFSLSPEYKFSTAFKEELLDLWPDLPSFGPGSQSELQNTNRGRAECVRNEQKSSNDTTDASSDCSPSTSQTSRRTNFSDSNASDDVPVVYLSDSPNSQNSYSSEEDSVMVIYQGKRRRESRTDESVVCLDNDDKESDKSLDEGDQIGKDVITPLQDTEDSEPSTNVADPSNHSQMADTDDGVNSESLESQTIASKLPASYSKQQLAQIVEKKIESERATIEKLKAELVDQKRNCEWQEAQVRYLEIKLQERNDFEYKLEAVNQRNDKLEKQLSDLERSASNLPVFEKELKRLREKTKLLEEDKRCKEELGQTISNLIDEKTNLKTENESLTSIASMLEKENSTLKQKCETLEKAAEKSLICSGENLISENCCIRTKELRDKMTESLENEFKCSICEEVFIEATVTNCNHVFCAHCLSEWMKKKKDCPYCRKHVSQQCRAPVIDEFVLTVCKLLSEKIYSDRLQVVQERKILSSKKVPQQPSSRKLPNGAVRVVPIASLRQMPPTTRPMSNVSYMRYLNSNQPAGHNYHYPSMMDDAMGGYDYYFNSVYTPGASSTATATATSSMASSSSSSSTVSAPPVQMLPLDARIARPVVGPAAQSTTAATSSMHVSSTSSTAPMPSSAPATSATTASSALELPAYRYSSWSASDSISSFLANSSSSLYGGVSRPTVAAVNPFSTIDDTSTVPRALSAAHRSVTRPIQ